MNGCDILDLGQQIAGTGAIVLLIVICLAGIIARLGNFGMWLFAAIAGASFFAIPIGFLVSVWQ
mgnify:CR=1 FL=1